MDYAKAFDDYADFLSYLKDTENEHVRSRPFTDFGKAVFGYYLFPVGSGLADPVSPDYAAAVSSASLVVWRKFGRELMEIPSVLGTLAELNAVSLGDPPLITYRLGGIPSAVDYREATSGVSRTYTVGLAGYKMTDRRLTSAAMRQYRALDWQFLIGAMDTSLLPRMSPSSNLTVGRPNL